MRKLLIYLLVSFWIVCIGGGVCSAAFAAPEDGSSVLADLQVDSNFSVLNYPSVNGDRSIDVIQIAEGSDGALFVYVYQPGGSIVTVSSINICQDSIEATERHWLNYDLVECSVEGSLGKYRVEGLTVKSNLLRYYDITSIYRLPFDDEITAVGHGTVVTGATLPNGNTTNEVAYEIGRCYMAVTVDGEVQYAEQHTEVVTVTNKTVGHVRYYDGFAWFTAYTDSHFVAFNTNRNIDSLFEADVYFVRQDYEVVHDGLFGDHYKYDDEFTEVKVLYAEKEHSNDSFGLLSHKYTWKEIQSVKDFITDTNLTNSALNAVEGMQWVLRFYESPFTQGGAGLAATEYGTRVTDVTILRLKFEENGTVYNLGVIDNKQQGDLEPDNTDTGPDVLGWWKDFLDSWNNFWNSIGKFFKDNWWIFAVLGAMFLLGILSIFFPVLRVVFKWLWIGIKWIFKILWYIISAPARLVVLLINKAKAKKEGSG